MLMWTECRVNLMHNRIAGRYFRKLVLSAATDNRKLKAANGRLADVMSP